MRSRMRIHRSVWCLTHLPCHVPVSAVTQGGAVGDAFEVVLDEMGPWRRDSSLSFKGRTQVRRLSGAAHSTPCPKPGRSAGPTNTMTTIAVWLSNSRVRPSTV